MLSLVSMTNSKKLMANTLIVRQNDPCKFVYFVSVGQFIVLRNVDYITGHKGQLAALVQTNTGRPAKEVEVRELEERLPFEDPHKFGGAVSYETKLMQLSILSNGKSFGDTNILNDWVTDLRTNEVFKSAQHEPFSVITKQPGEVYYIERHVFLECIGQEDAEEFLRSRSFIPKDPELRKQFYSQVSWNKFKKDNIHYSPDKKSNKF